MKEFRVIDAAQTEEQLKLRLKPNELEEYGESFTPEFAYQVIRQLPRFRDMRVSLSVVHMRRFLFNLLTRFVTKFSEATSKMLRNSSAFCSKRCTRNVLGPQRTHLRRR